MAWYDRPEGFVAKSFDTPIPVLFEDEDDGCPHCGPACATCPECEQERQHYPAQEAVA